MDVILVSSFSGNFIDAMCCEVQIIIFIYYFVESRSAAEAESDAEDLIVESESDSDQSNPDGGQRSVQTGATAGSDSGG